MKPVGADDEIEAPFTAMLDSTCTPSCASRGLVMLSPKMISHDPPGLSNRSSLWDESATDHKNVINRKTMILTVTIY